MQSPRITEAAFSLLGGEGRPGKHALVRHAGEGLTFGFAVILLTRLRSPPGVGVGEAASCEFSAVSFRARSQVTARSIRPWRSSETRRPATNPNFPLSKSIKPWI